MDVEYAATADPTSVRLRGEPRQLEIDGPQDRRISMPACGMEATILVHYRDYRKSVPFLALDSEVKGPTHLEFNSVAHIREVVAGLTLMADELEAKGWTGTEETKQ